MLLSEARHAINGSNGNSDETTPLNGSAEEQQNGGDGEDAHNETLKGLLDSDSASSVNGNDNQKLISNDDGDHKESTHAATPPGGKSYAEVVIEGGGDPTKIKSKGDDEDKQSSSSASASQSSSSGMCSDPAAPYMKSQQSSSVSSTTADDPQTAIEQVNGGSRNNTFKCYNKSRNWSYHVQCQQDTTPSQQKCYIVTVPDIGQDCTRFQQFIACEEMAGIRSRVVWLHVTMPGQERNAEDFKPAAVAGEQPQQQPARYPSFDELADELVCVLDYFKVPQAVMMGDGAGANICARFALKHASRCHGVVLVEPNASTTSFIESLRFRFTNMNLFSMMAKGRANVTSNDKANVVCNRYGRRFSNDYELLQVANKQVESSKLFENYNQKNLLLYLESYINRTSIMEKMGQLKMDMLITIAKSSYNYSESKRLYKTVRDARIKRDPKALVNSPCLEVEDVCNVMYEAPDRLATSLQYYLQGIGLISALPMMKPSHAKKMRSASTATESSQGTSISGGSETGGGGLSEVGGMPVLLEKPLIDESNVFVSSNVSIGATGDS